MRSVTTLKPLLNLGTSKTLGATTSLMLGSNTTIGKVNVYTTTYAISCSTWRSALNVSYVRSAIASHARRFVTSASKTLWRPSPRTVGVDRAYRFLAVLGSAFLLPRRKYGAERSARLRHALAGQYVEGDALAEYRTCGDS